jgi:hypothetical protein
MTTKCSLSDAKIRDYEISAAGGDTLAMRELDICYQFSERDADQQRIHRMRVNSNDPEALDEEAWSFLSQAKKTGDVVKKRELLNRALELADRAARGNGLNDYRNDPTIKQIDQEIASLP